MSNERHSTDAARHVNPESNSAIDLSDGMLIPLGKLHLHLKRRKELITEWRREGLEEEIAFRMDGRTLYVWSEDVRDWIKKRYRPKRK